MRIPFTNFEIRLFKKKRQTTIPTYVTSFFFDTPEIDPTNFQQLIKGYRDWIYVCATKNAINVAQVPLRLYAAKPSSRSKIIVPHRVVPKEQREFLETKAHLRSLTTFRKAVEVVEVLDHPFLDLLKNVNPFMNQFSLLELTQLHQELVGNTYWFVLKGQNNIPSELWILEPQYVKIVPDKKTFIKHYKYERNWSKPTIYELDEIVHFKVPNPTNPYYGMSPLAAIFGPYSIGIKMDTYENSVFANSGNPSGIIEYEGVVGEHEYRRTVERLREQYAGLKKAGKLMLLEGGAKYKPIGLSPKELNFLQGRRYIKEIICNAYGQHLGMYDKDANRANAETASYLYMRDTITPRLVRLEQKINEQLMPMYDDALFVSFDNCIPEDKKYRLEETRTYIEIGFRTINELRAELGLDPVPWGDEPINLVKGGSNGNGQQSG